MNNWMSDEVIPSTVELYADLTHQGHMRCSAIRAISRQSYVEWKLSRCKCNVNWQKLCKNFQKRWQSYKSMNKWRYDDLTGSTVGLYTDLTHQRHIGRSAILAISRQSDVKSKLSRCKCNVNRPTLCINWQIGWQSIGGMNNRRSEDVIGSTVGLYTDLTHQGHTGRSAVLAISRQADVKWKLSRCKCNVNRPKLCINWQLGWQSNEGMNNKRSDDVIGSTVEL
jgi:hypothetical protein